MHPWVGRLPGEGDGNPLQYSCLENSWTEEPGGLQSTGSQESDTTERLTLSYTILDLGFTFWGIVFLETKVTISKLCISSPQYNCRHTFYKYVLNEYVIKNQKAKIIFNRKTLDKVLLNSTHYLL